MTVEEYQGRTIKLKTKTTMHGERRTAVYVNGAFVWDEPARALADHLASVMAYIDQAELRPDAYPQLARKSAP